MTDRLRRIADALQYAVAITAVVSLVFLPVGFLTAAGLFWVKFGLFLAGMVTIGYATYLAWPSSPDDVSEGRVDVRRETRFQAAVRRLPPASWLPVASMDRYPNWVKLYLASLVMLGTSYVMEAVFGVTA